MSNIQSVIFNKHLFSIQKAQNWLKAHNLKLLKGKHVDTTLNFHRFRIRSPLQFRRFITKKIQPGIEIIIGFYK